MEARFFTKLEDSRVRCTLCAHRCVIAPGRRGRCGVRENREGVLHTDTYGAVISEQVDPIEKKPLYHMLPGSRAYSIGTLGCNFTCSFCQNWRISQADERPFSRVRPGRSPKQIVEAAIDRGCSCIAYTYNEPTVFMEFALDTAHEAIAGGIRNVFVTNGFMSREALEAMRGVIQACNIDLKSSSDGFYRSLCTGSLQPVRDSIEWLWKNGIWVEVTTLVVPGENDSGGDIRGVAEFIASLDRDIPWHVSRFHPGYRMRRAGPTAPASLDEAVRIGREAGLRYMYIGNLPVDSSTYCPSCGRLLIERSMFEVANNSIRNGACPECSEKIPGIWE